MTAPDDLCRRLTDLERELDRLRSDVRALLAVPGPNGDAAVGGVRPPDASGRRAQSTRRTLLHRSAIAAGAGLVGAGFAPRLAAAADGDAVRVGQAVSGTKTTQVSSSGVGADAVWGNSTAQSGESWGVRGTSFSPSGIGAVGQNHALTGSAIGVRGVASSFEGVGVEGVAENSAGFAIGVRGRSHSGDGAAVHGEHLVVDGVGVGVLGTATSRFGYGLRGTNDRGVAVSGASFSVNGVGGEFSGQRAAVSLIGSGPDPRTTTSAHVAGDLYLDSTNDLWLCTKSGTPGTWFKLTARGVVPVAPFRVYDSRFVDGPFVRATNRLLDVRDAIDVVTGAVVKKNAVPGGTTAVLFNVAVTNTVGAGFVAAAPGNATKISSASINWSATGQTLNNGTFVQLDGSRRMRVFADGTPGSRSDVIIDVTGVVLD